MNNIQKYPTSQKRLSDLFLDSLTKWLQLRFISVSHRKILNSENKLILEDGFSNVHLLKMLIKVH